MNAAEMADNPDLDEYVVHDLNVNLELPFADNIFDAVVVTVSVQYMTHPIETFKEVNRILKVGGVFMAVTEALSPRRKPAVVHDFGPSQVVIQPHQKYLGVIFDQGTIPAYAIDKPLR